MLVLEVRCQATALKLGLFPEKKDRLEAENQSLLLTFGSRLDQSLKDLHKTILGSVAEQQEQIRCIEEHVCSFLASKCDVSNRTKHN